MGRVRAGALLAPCVGDELSLRIRVMMHTDDVRRIDRPEYWSSLAHEPWGATAGLASPRVCAAISPLTPGAGERAVACPRRSGHAKDVTSSICSVPIERPPQNAPAVQN
jgi:hypothetical protein